MSGDTTEQHCTGTDPVTGSDANRKPVDDKYMAADTEVDILMRLSQQDPVSQVETPVQCVLPPSPPVDVNHNAALSSDDQPTSGSDVDDPMQTSSMDDSAGYVSCNSSVLAATDETLDDLQSTADIPSSAVFHRSKHLMSAASKYRLRCQCGAKNCRQYLY